MHVNYFMCYLHYLYYVLIALQILLKTGLNQSDARHAGEVSVWGILYYLSVFELIKLKYNKHNF